MGIALLVILYAIRAVIRSTQLKDITLRVEKRIRETSRVPETDEIPSRVIISYVWQSLGPVSRAFTCVLPACILTLTLIDTLSDSVAFKVLSNIEVVLVSIITMLLISLERGLLAVQVTNVSIWLLCLLSTTAGRPKPVNTAVMAVVMCFITTICLLLFAILPQRLTRHPFKRVWQIVLPLWTLFLPFMGFLQGYLHSDPKWGDWRLPVSTCPFVVLLAIIPAGYPEPLLVLIRTAAIGAVCLGVPLPFIWYWWPHHWRDQPERIFTYTYAYFPPQLWLQVLFTLAAMVLCLLVLISVFAGTPLTSKTPIERVLAVCGFACVLLATPIITVWVPGNTSIPAGTVPLFAKLLVTLGAALFFCLACLLLNMPEDLRRLLVVAVSLIVCVGIPAVMTWTYVPGQVPSQERYSIAFSGALFVCIILQLAPWFRRDWIWSNILLGIAMLTLAAWLPCLIWLTDYEALAPLRKNKSAMIHVTWVSGVFWLAVWWVLYVVRKRLELKWLAREEERRRENERQTLRSNGPS